MGRRAGFQVTAVAMTLALVAGGCGRLDEAASEDDGTVKIGLAAAFSGETAYYGQDSKIGVELALEELKKSRPDTKFELVTADDECTPQGGASAFRRLADVDKVDVILGSPCSSGTLGGMPTLTKSKVPAMTFGATNAKITAEAGDGGNAYMWRMNVDDSIMGKYWAKYIADAGIKRVAILAANNDFGRGAADLYKTLLPDAGVTLGDTEFYDLGSSDLRPQLTKIRAAKPQALITFAEPPDCAQMLRQMHEMGLDLKMYGRGGCATAEGIEATGNPKLAEGVREATYWAPTASQKDMLAAYKAKEKKDIPAYNTALAYYGMMTLAEAVKQGGNDRAGIQEGLGKVDFDTGIGPITFDDHNQAHPNMFILEVAKGKVKVLETVDTST